MRIDEMRSREAFDTILTETLAAGWSKQFGRKIALTCSRDSQAQQWWCQGLLNAFFTAEITRVARRFLVNSFRISPRLYRLAPQYALGTLLGTPPVLLKLSAPAFCASPAVPEAANLLVIPGNQRIRVFDFARGICRVMLKKGFPVGPMKRDVETRGHTAAGRFKWCPPVRGAAEDGTWFEEDILEALPLPRCPPTMFPARRKQEALTKLESWLAVSLRQTSSREWSAQLIDQLEGRRRDLESRWGAHRFQPLWHWKDRLAQEAERLGRVDVAVGHGDLQPGNILVGSQSGRVFIIDWERSTERIALYDRLVLTLSTRYASTRQRGIESFMSGKLISGLEHVPRDIGWRRAIAALFLLEELWWYVEECFLGPYHIPAPGLMDYLGLLDSPYNPFARQAR